LYNYLLGSNVISPRENVSTTTLGGSKSSRQGKLTAFALAGHIHHDISVGETGGFSRVGLRYLCRYLVTFDFGRNKLYLAPGRRYRESDHRPFLGATLRRRGGETLVVAVDKGSPAQAAGVLVDDRLIAINGQLVGEKPLAEVRWETDRIVARGPVEFMVRRNDERLTLAITPDNGSVGQ
jgi:hypothetical protein